MLQQLPQNPIFCRFWLKKIFLTKKIQKKSKNQNWAIFDFSLIGSSVFELWLKNCKSGKAGVHLANREVLCCPTVSVIHRWSHRMLLPAFYLWSFLLDTQWATEKGSCWQAIYTFFLRHWICFQDPLWEFFPPLALCYKWWEFFPPLALCYKWWEKVSQWILKTDPVPEKKV